MNVNNLVTFCNDVVCYTGIYSPHHPNVPPGIVYGLANGVIEKLPLVLYQQPIDYTQSYFSYMDWIMKYYSISGIMLMGASIFKYLFLKESHLKSHDENDGKPNIIEYSKKYYDKYDALCKQSRLSNPHEDKNEQVPKTKNDHETMHLNHVIDYTGQYGNVMMYYNSESEAFDYFADNKNIPFTYLETVSRKLGIAFHCTNKIIDRRDNPQNEQNTDSDSKKRNKKHKDPRNVSNIVNAKSNKFIYVGKFASFNPLQTLLYDEASPCKKSIRSNFSFKEYMASLKYT